ncbi:hypothetical protein [Halomicrococcus sp. NG-SE-24]|uniref:hypothetical protein n=1 Tax=Halomicrococcus sp. NG-SE-24 TaxID=3436928 RepID=UPI003D96EC50
MRENVYKSDFPSPIAAFSWFRWKYDIIFVSVDRVPYATREDICYGPLANISRSLNIVVGRAVVTEVNDSKGGLEVVARNLRGLPSVVHVPKLGATEVAYVALEGCFI